LILQRGTELEGINFRGLLSPFRRGRPKEYLKGHFVHSLLPLFSFLLSSLLLYSSLFIPSSLFFHHLSLSQVLFTLPTPPHSSSSSINLSFSLLKELTSLL
jgi:hypothetical protein